MIATLLVPALSFADSLPLSLKEAVFGTLNSNISIAVEGFNTKIKKEAVKDSESEFDPTIGMELTSQEQTIQSAVAGTSTDKGRNQDTAWNLSLSQKLVTGAEYSLEFNNGINKTNSPNSGLNPSYDAELQLDFTQPLLKNFGIDTNKRNIYIANNDVNISEFGFRDKVISVISDVENIYWDLVFSIEDLRVKQTSLGRAKDLERRVKAQVDVGTLAPLEILQAKSEVASREQLLVSAEDLITDNEDKLKNTLNLTFLGIEGDKKITPVDAPVFFEKLDLNVDEAIKESLLSRPDYLAKRKELENKRILVQYNENQIYPSLDLVASLGLNGLAGDAKPITRFSGGTVTSQFDGGYGESLSNMFSSEYFLWKFGVQLSYPLGNKSAESQLTSARLESAQLLMDLKDLERQITVEVREAARQVKTDIKRVEAARVARKLAEEKLDAEEQKFAVGLSTSFNVLEFQEDLAEEQSNEIKSLTDLNKSRINLRKAMATTLDEYGIKLSETE
ncbi:MAG: TolC family protein [Candidatus Nitrohelix vancouverensis]|uniref:TolC family protein n=1 Tax=Candidatus Nitrohelix vancouverensis TaxID=2705534 RepID=A0A7T0C3K4_9BACT|nr:MAG: TolC family protein [Candidatus Nitrohelix vancouverensis]